MKAGQIRAEGVSMKRQRKRDTSHPFQGRRSLRRSGQAAVDYVLLLGVLLPTIVFLLRIGPRIMRAAYEMCCVLIAWPFM